ncbi:MAG: biotin carboxylase N-terminal domain-containing protein [Dehalococcoidia bacterium]
MFEAVLVANRGEIAVRVTRTLRRMGIRAVVVASALDRHSLAVRMADTHVLLPGYSAAETYLDAGLVLAAARATGCEAIHPGYGFLSERADFAERCQAEGLTFIGPTPASIRAVGDKSAARALAVSAGVPVVPGYDGPDDDRALLNAATAVGFPLLVKARGGGGGRGMRVVESPAALPEAVASARREALSAFGDGGLLLERLVTGAHHVEVQIFGDQSGNLVHLGERDCSVQRRRQKLIEEAPSPVVDGPLRERLTAAALAIGRAANYENAGTVEFLVGAPDAGSVRPFWFLEVNPRLQVEHPVTEAVTGFDLVEWQLHVAAGGTLPVAQADIRVHGHAIELRVNAEDPAAGFAPSTGRIRAIATTPGERADFGYAPGDRVPGEYDSLAGKRIFTGATRSEALAVALGAPPSLAGLRTNEALLTAVLGHPSFRDGGVDTRWLERELPNLVALPATAGQWAEAAARNLDGARWIGAGEVALWLTDGRATREVRSGTAGVLIDGEPISAAPVAADSDPAIRLASPPRLPPRKRDDAAAVRTVRAPLAGTVAAVHVAVGDAVSDGTLLLTIEAMKMEHRVVAPTAGTVRELAVGPRSVIREGDLLVELA